MISPCGLSFLDGGMTATFIVAVFAGDAVSPTGGHIPWLSFGVAPHYGEKSPDFLSAGTDFPPLERHVFRLYELTLRSSSEPRSRQR